MKNLDTLLTVKKKSIFLFVLAIAFNFSLVKIADAQKVGITDAASITPKSLLHVDQNAATGTLFQLTNTTSGNGAQTNGFIINMNTSFKTEFKNQYNNSAAGISFFTNTGADQERFTILNNGNVGIGSTAPAQVLDVNGTAKMTGFQLGTSTTSGWVLTADASGVGTWQVATGGSLPPGTSGQTLRYNAAWEASSLLYNDGINIGIGSTSPSEALDVNGEIKGSKIGLGTNPTYHVDILNTGNDAFIRINTTVASKAAQILFTRSSVNYFGPAADNYFDLWINEAIPFRIATSGTERLRILSTGNVGINSTTPSQKLDVVGVGRFTTGDVASLYSLSENTAFVGQRSAEGGAIRLNTSYVGPPAWTVGNFTIQNYCGSLRFYAQTPGGANVVAYMFNNLYFAPGWGWAHPTLGGTGDMLWGNVYTKGSMNLYNSGETKYNAFQTQAGQAVDITYNLPTAQGAASSFLQNDGSGTLSWATASGGATGPTGPTGSVGGTGTAGQVAYWSDATNITGNNNLYWDNVNGRLGIGTTTPNAGLSIYKNGASRTWLTIVNSNGTSESSAIDLNGLTHSWEIGTDVNTNGGDDFYIYGNSGFRFTINSAGNVGIGTSAPSAKLDIDGGLAIRSSGSTVTITVDGQAVTVGDRSYIRLTSNTTTSTGATFTISNGVREGQILVLEAVDNGSYEIELADGGNCRLAATWPATSSQNNDMITLIWNGTSWNELARAAN